MLPREPEPPATARVLARTVSDFLGRRVHPRRIGEAIAAARLEGLHVWSGSGKRGLRGYRIAASTDALGDCAKEHERRAKASLQIGARLRGMSVRDVAQQMGLFDAAAHGR